MRYDQIMRQHRAILAVKFASVSLMLVCLVRAIPALAQTPPMDSEALAQSNMCDWNFSQFLNSPSVTLARKYAKTGEVPDPPLWKSNGPRTWYMAALGMKSTLRRYLTAHPNAVNDPDLLNMAISAGQGGIVAMLIGRGADPNTPGIRRKVLPLTVAANCARPEIMRQLLRAGANVYGTVPHGKYVALLIAMTGSGLSMKPFYEGVKLILAAGFDPRCPVDKRGYTGLELVDKNITLPGRKKLQRIFLKSIKAAKKEHPSRPSCGGLDWSSQKPAHSR